ncbi:hypothetical protein JXA02_02070 [candidate division KSB1 bacterium]|nr:hypothetical protein [candidate division KSB1 bacterium]RQW10493.1 MAG: hypothetical protein EH222_02265 [candidate division KSB1 bacterium]
MKKHWIVTAILALSVTAILFSACQESTESDAQRPSIQDGIRFNREARRQSLQAETARVDSMRAEAEVLLRSLREKEDLLQEKQAELEVLRKQLQQKERELVLREQAAQRTRRSGAWLFAIGVALITLSLILFISKVKRRPKSAAPLSTVDLADSAIIREEKPKQMPLAKQEAPAEEKKDAIAAPVKTKPTAVSSRRAPRAKTKPGETTDKAGPKRTGRTRARKSEKDNTAVADDKPAVRESKTRAGKKPTKSDEDKGATESPQA